MTRHPLPPAYQHTQCWMAVAATRATIDRYTPAGRGALDAHIAKITRWIDVCCDDIRRKKPSAGAQRETKAACDRMTAHMTPDGLEGEALFMRWAASVWAALTLLEDCRIVCPHWFRGRHWHYLLQTMDTLARGLVRLEPTVAEIGTHIYEEVAA